MLESEKHECLPDGQLDNKHVTEFNVPKREVAHSAADAPESMLRMSDTPLKET
jgi:hypothetical protein